jgi:hypothetical protein
MGLILFSFITYTYFYKSFFSTNSKIIVTSTDSKNKTKPTMNGKIGLLGSAVVIDDLKSAISLVVPTIMKKNVQ